MQMQRFKAVAEKQCQMSRKLNPLLDSTVIWWAECSRFSRQQSGGKNHMVSEEVFWVTPEWTEDFSTITDRYISYADFRNKASYFQWIIQYYLKRQTVTGCTISEGQFKVVLVWQLPSNNILRYLSDCCLATSFY